MPHVAQHVAFDKVRLDEEGFDNMRFGKDEVRFDKMWSLLMIDLPFGFCPINKIISHSIR